MEEEDNKFEATEYFSSHFPKTNRQNQTEERCRQYLTLLLIKCYWQRLALLVESMPSLSLLIVVSAAPAPLNKIAKLSRIGKKQQRCRIDGVSD